MCTKITGEIKSKKQIHAWKVVQVGDSSNPLDPLDSFDPLDKSVFSIYKKTYLWTPAKWNYPFHKCNGETIGPDNVFHCFARRSDARKCKTNQKEYDTKCHNGACRYAIIKLILSGKILKGTTQGMGIIECNDMPALCATEAYWDGKFVR